MPNLKAIIVIEKGEVMETWGSLRDVCKEHPEIDYNRVARLQFPFTESGWKIRKVRYKVKGG